MGYDLPLLLGHLEALAEDEAETLPTKTNGRKWKRHELVEAAIQNLNDAMEMGNEER
jgi:hypothetical protein